MRTYLSTLFLASAALLDSTLAQDSGSTTDELSLLMTRRKADLGSNAVAPDKVGQWATSQQADGTWSDVNYLSGCEAQ
jgi:hypothetical protein